MVNYETPLGKVTLSAEVLETVVGLAVNDCFGVAGMAARDTMDSIVSLLKKARLDKGVKIFPMGDDIVSIELHIMVVYGLNIAAVSRSIVSKIKYTVEELTGLTVHEVTICVDDMKA
ncbi:MAG: Asp23/Gls24 family envelope stress response protein [Clostridiales bacterium]|nr:Asp23/Gls24 family envelope stress response protein [Clostridiales bacterium]